MVQPGAGKTRQRPQVDMNVVVVIMASHKTRQHAGIRRVDVAADEGEANAGQRLHAELSENRDVAVTAADQDQVLDDRR